MTDMTDSHEIQNGSVQDKKEKRDLLYSVDEVPPWYLCIVLGLQQYLTAFGAILAVPRFLAPALCMDEDYLGLSQVIGTIFFVSGLVTLLQTSVGCRLPIIQGATFSFLAPTFAILSLRCCPFNDKNNCNMTKPVVGSDEHKAIWQDRLTEVQGAIMVSSIFQVVIGFSGLMGFVLQFIGPLAIVPTVSLVGLSLFGPAATFCAEQWWIAVMTIFFIILFSQYLRNVKVPLPAFTRGRGCRIGWAPIFRLFPILLGMCLSWLVCYILTITNALPTDKDKWGYGARSDAQESVLHSAAWFRFPYPGQWGVPTVTTAGVFGMLAGVLASMVESVGDYYACARLSGAPPPPEHAINRGIGVEGIGCILAGAWGTGNGTTSYSENIGSIGITKVGSRRVVQVGGVIMILLGCLGKFGALFVTIPNPVIGGMFIVMFGMVSAVGLSNLQFVDLNSSRNLFILGFSLFFGITLPNWLSQNPGVIQTGNDIADQILTVLCSTSMFVGGLLGFFLDNTIPGTDEERGIIKWRQLVHSGNGEDPRQNLKTYDFPFIQNYLNRLTWPSYIPFCPSFVGFGSCLRSDKRDLELSESPTEAHRSNKEGFVNDVAYMEDGNDIVIAQPSVNNHQNSVTTSL